MIRRTVAMIALAASVAGCSAAAEPNAPDESASGQAARAPQVRSDIEAELDCHLVDNADYSAGRGATEQAAVDALTGWYPPISRTMRWLGAAAGTGSPRGAGTPEAPGAAADHSAVPEVRASTWLLFAQDGRGYGTATVSQPDPALEQWSAAVSQLCVVVVPPAPEGYTDLTADGRPTMEPLTDPANAEFVRAMETAVVGLAEGDAADALRAVGWRVRVGEREGVRQDNVGSASSWINLAIAEGMVTGFTVG